MRTLLENGEKSVGELETMTGVGQPGLSQQLAILRKADLVQTRREAKLVFYSLAPDNLESTAKLLCALAGVSARDMQSETRSARPRAGGSAATFAKIIKDKSTRRSASARSSCRWLTTIRPVPVSQSQPSIRRVSCVSVFMSSPSLGSSSKSHGFPARMARAIDNRLRCPPDSRAPPSPTH